MAAQAWKAYDEFKRYMGDNTIDMDAATFDMHIVLGTSNFATQSLSTLGSLTNELASGNGYTQSGKALTSVTWSTGASTGEMRFDAADMGTWTATGGDWNSLRALVIVARTGASGKDGANKLVCYASMSSANFNLTDTNTLDVAFAATGILELNNA